MRVNVDDKVHSDPRVDRLAARLKMNRHEALGRLLRPWNFCYQLRSALIAAMDVDALADCKGFAKAMVAVELADAKRGEKVRIRGIEERIQFLISQDANRAKALAAKALLRDRPAGSRSDEDAKQTRASRGKSRGGVPIALDSDQAAAAAQDPSRTPEQAAQQPAAMLSSLPASPDGLKPPAAGAAAREIRKAIADGVSAEDCQQAAEQAIEKRAPFKNAKHLDFTIAAFVRKVHEDHADGGGETETASGWESPL